MVNLANIISFYPERLRKHKKFILKEYLQYKILDALYRSEYAEQLVFIGGTCLRIVYDNQRFSEDLDFDNFGLTAADVDNIGALIKKALEKEGYKVETKKVVRAAFHCYIKFPSLLYEHQLSEHKHEKILISLDTFSQGFAFKPRTSFISKFDVFTPILTAPLDLLFSQKVFAILNRKRNKGRDFFDLSFLMTMGVEPNMAYLKEKLGITNKKEMKMALLAHCGQIDMLGQANDVAPFLFDAKGSDRVRYFVPYLESTT